MARVAPIGCILKRHRLHVLMYITPMKILFAHQNFPGQFKHLASHLAATGKEVVFITQRKDAELPGVKKIVYQPKRAASAQTHRYLRDTEASTLNAQAVAEVAHKLKRAGFVPDLMVGHNGWGEIWYLKDVFPSAPLLGYFEFFYRLHGADVGFDPSFKIDLDTGPRIRTKNLGNLLGLDAADLGQCPTEWQKLLYPARYHGMLEVAHEGVDTGVLKPDASAQFEIAEKNLVLSAADEVVTYVSRNLEPYRGFPSFMQSLPSVLQRRPNAHVVIVGGDETSYGPPPAGGGTFRQQMLDQLKDSLDLSRVHFTGKIPYQRFVKLLQISSAHVYLTYPFVLSWSMLEAMAVQCLVIGSDTAPVKEVIRDGENGLLVDFFSPQQIADRVVDALSDRAAFAAIRKAARQTVVDRYDLKRICLPAQLQLLERLRGK
jgi:glycosyltransferase involved in cell wall biosynthesis